jgi:hypothetical protein
MVFTALLRRLYGEWSILGHAKDALLRNLVEAQAGGLQFDRSGILKQSPKL